MKLKLKSLILLLGMWSPLLSASLHIEPYGSMGVLYSSAISPNSSFFMQSVLGGRVGYNFFPLSLGVDVAWTYYHIGDNVKVVEVQHQSDTPRGLAQATSSLSVGEPKPLKRFYPLSVGVWSALELPIFFDIYGGLFYAFGNKKGGKGHNLSHRGYGVKVGLSWLSALYVQVNTELQWVYYHCKGSESCSSKFSTWSALVSLSVPFSANIFGGNNSNDSTAMEDSTVNDSPVDGPTVEPTAPPSSAEEDLDSSIEAT